LPHESHNDRISSDLLRCGARGSDWQSAPSEIRLPPNEVHVWRASLACEPATLRGLEATLAEDEKSRAQRFLFERDRNHFIGGRGILRDLLGKYLSWPPGGLRFRYGPQEKPALDAKKIPKSPRFNLSHSHGLAVFAFSLDREVGIDLELIRPDFATDEIAARYFSTSELAELRSLPEESRAEGFFLCWTRKEAYVKARGAGLHIPLNSFSVSLTPGQPERLESSDTERWTVWSFQPAAGFVGTIIAEGSGWQLRQFDWQPSSP
jgi:4'-phosphopantetheinyl transferase